MTLKEVFKNALELEREDMHRLVDSLTAVLEVGAAVAVPEPKTVKTRVRRVKKQKTADKVQAGAVVDGTLY